MKYIYTSYHSHYLELIGKLRQIISLVYFLRFVSLNFFILCLLIFFCKFFFKIVILYFLRVPFFPDTCDSYIRLLGLSTFSSSKTHCESSIVVLLVLFLYLSTSMFSYFNLIFSLFYILRSRQNCSFKFRPPLFSRYFYSLCYMTVLLFRSITC